MRTDTDIKRDVEDEFRWDPTVDATDIGVAVHDGVVTLAGFVRSYAQKLDAERDAVSALKAELPYSSENIRVTARRGWLTLEGTVEWNYARETAESAVKRVRGVKGVTNSTTLKPKATPYEVRRLRRVSRRWTTESRSTFRGVRKGRRRCPCHSRPAERRRGHAFPPCPRRLLEGDDHAHLRFASRMRVASVGDTVTEIKVGDLPAWLVDYHLEVYMRSIDKAEVPLTDAILRAEERASAPAIGAGLAKPLSGSNAVLAYYVETMASGKRRVLAIDAKNGTFISNPESLYEPHTPVKLARRLAS
jgi:osmotically-inducible protein OsmY